jgi:hypothetical protein
LKKKKSPGLEVETLPHDKLKMMSRGQVVFGKTNKLNPYKKWI